MIAIGPTGQGLLQAGDGNFYGRSNAEFEACQNNPNQECAFIYQITPAGVIAPLHSFQPISTSTGPTAANADGLWPTALIVGTDGNLYGACAWAGPGGGGTIFEITLSGTFTLLKSFGYGNGTSPADPGIQPNSLVQAADGTLYFTNGIGVYQLTIAGTSSTVTTVYTFTPDATTGGYTNGANPTTLMQGSDGNLYLTLQTGQQTAPSDVTSGAIAQLNPLTRQLTVIHNLNPNGSEGIGPDGPMVQGSDGYLYGVTKNHTTTPLVAFKVSTGGAYSVLHPFNTGDAAGALPNSALFVGSDGNLYGTARVGGDTTSTSCTPTGCGTVFQLTPTGTLTTLHTFEGGTPTSTVVSQNPQVDGAVPWAPLVQANDGTFYGTTFFNVIFKTALTPALPPPVQLTLNPATVAVNSTATLTWKVLNAYSLTAQQCGAYLQGGTGGGNWSGPQPGALVGGYYTGSATIKPTAPGIYTYALVCGGNEAGFVSMTVPAGFTITSPVLPQGMVNETYTASLTATGGTTPYTWSASGLPPGLSLNVVTGAITGKPIQFGNYTASVTVTDSAEPANQVTSPVTLNVVSGLLIQKASLAKATVSAPYLDYVSAKFGLPPYTWSITSGSLPNGLTLDPNTGIVSGTPTAPGNSTITVQVADSESTAATVSATLTLKVVPTIQIAAVEFTQAIQQYQTLDDLQSSLTANGEPPVPMVSGKPAVMRVYFTNLKDSTDVTLTVTGTAAGQKAMNLPPDCPPSYERLHINYCPSMDFYFTPESGAWTTTLTLNDGSGNQLEQETLAVTSRDTASVYLKGVSICSVPDQPTSCQDQTGLPGLLWFAQKVLPTNSVTPGIVSMPIYEDPDSYLNQDGTRDLQTWEGAIAYDLNGLYSPVDAQADSSSNQYTDYVGIYSKTIDSTGMGLRPGHGLTIPNQTTRQGIEATAQVLAHETGHTLNLPHTGTVTPGGSVPGTCYGPGAVTLPTQNQWLFPDNYLQSLMNGYEDGFDVEAQTVIDGSVTFDVMAYCMPRWISPYNYKNLFPFVNGGTVTSPNVKRGKGLAASQVTATPSVTYAQGSYLSINGTIPSTGIVLSPIFTETMIGTSDSGTGTYSIQEQGAGGQVLYTRSFDPVVGQTDTTGTDFQTNPMFSEYIPVTAGTTAIVVLDPTGAALTSVAMTGAPPVVTITSPGAGFVGSGQQTVSWTATSATATSFASRIYYSIDGGTTWQAVLNTIASTATLDFNTLPGAAAALIRVDVSDGVNTGSATSAAFSVPKKTPVSIVINNPVSGAIQQAANPVYLVGAAYDPDDGVLTGTALQWSDSVQGSLGTGSPLSVSLEPGNHTITLTATDSDGNALTATTQITLGGGAPVVTLTSSETVNCFNATINATPGSQGANLTAVNYSLNGGSTYTAIPLTSLPFSFPISGSGTVNVVAVAADASGQVSSQSQQISGCVATTLKAGAGSGQNALVGTAFTTALTTLVVDVNGNPVSGATVTYAAPATGASATLSAATAVTNSSGIATVNATANGVAGAYSVTANTSSATAAASFALANSDFQVSAGTATLPVSPGSSGTDSITLTALGGFNGTVTFTCSGLPASASCSFTPATITPTAATTSTTMTIAVAQTTASNWPAEGASVLACCIVGFIARRRRGIAILAAGIIAAGLLMLTGCGGSSSKGHGVGPSTSTVTINAASGGLQRTTTITLEVQ